MRRMDDGSIDLVVTSPPYDNLRDYKGYSFPFEDIARSLYQVMKKGGVIVWVVGDQTVNGSETGTSFRQVLYFKEIGFNLHDTMIWNKNNVCFPETNRYYSTFEYMFIFSKGKPSTYNLIADKKNISIGRQITGTERQLNGKTKPRSNKQKSKKIKEYGIRHNIWNISPIKNNREGSHPAMFPEQLAFDHIISWSNENDIVYDPFTGSGTTAKMAIKLNRKYIGSEISEEYCQLAKKRIRDEELKLSPLAV